MLCYINIWKYIFPFFFWWKCFQYSYAWILHKRVGVSLGYTACLSNHRFVGSASMNFYYDSKMVALSVCVWAWSPCSPHGHRSTLSPWVLPDCSSLFSIRVSFCSKLLLPGCSVCSHPVSCCQHTTSAHTKYLRVLDTFLSIWVEEERFPVQYSEHIPSIPVHTRTFKTLLTTSSEWSFWSHSVLTCLLTSAPKSSLPVLFFPLSQNFLHFQLSYPYISLSDL